MSNDFLDLVSMTKAAEKAKSQLSIRRASACGVKSQLLLRMAGMPQKKEGEDTPTNNKEKKEHSNNKKNKNKGRTTKDQRPAKKINSKDNGAKTVPAKNDSDGTPKDGTSPDLPDWYEELDQENLNAFRDLFNMLDQSNTGIITADNLYNELTNIDSDITYQEVEDLLKKVDKDGNGEIDFDEFLFHMTQMGDDLFGDVGAPDHEERKNKYSRRQKLFYNAITQFSIKQTLADIEKTFRIRQAPHVISHYTAGARLIGLTTRQLERQMKKMQKTARNDSSPYAKPLQFVHMGAKGIVRRKNVKHKTANDETRDIGKALAGVASPMQEADPISDLSQEIKDSLKFLAQRNVGNKVQDARLIMELRQKIGTVSAQLKNGADQIQKLPAPQTDADSPEAKPKSAPLRFQKQGPPVKSKTCYGKPVSAYSAKKRRGTHCATPRIEYMKVPLPSLKMKSGAHKATFNELHEIRAKANQATDEYYSRLRQTEIRHAWEHWDRLYAFIKPKEEFRKVYCVYSPHREEETFVICPWKPGPFVYIRHNHNGGGNNRSTSSPELVRTTPKSFRSDNSNLVVQTIKSLE